MGVLALGGEAGVGVRAHPEISQQIEDVTARLAEKPDDASLYLRRGELHRIHRDWRDAEADFRRAARVAPDLAIVDLHRGRLSLDTGDAKRARKLLSRFLEARPEHLEGRILRARAWAALGRHDLAVSDYDAALRGLAPDARPRPGYYLERAEALRDAGRIAEAIRGLDEGLERLGHPVTLQLLAIDLEVQRGRHGAALERLDRIAAASARKEAWLIRKGEILEAAGHPVEARQAYHEAVRAIESLPVARRSTRAVRDLADSAEAALARLEDRR